jgi:hypothetical protein
MASPILAVILLLVSAAAVTALVRFAP